MFKFVANDYQADLVIRKPRILTIVIEKPTKIINLILIKKLSKFIWVLNHHLTKKDFCTLDVWLLNRFEIRACRERQNLMYQAQILERTFECESVAGTEEASVSDFDYAQSYRCCIRPARRIQWFLKQKQNENQQTEL